MAQEKLKTMLMQSFGVTNKQYHGMLWYFLEWSITSLGFEYLHRKRRCEIRHSHISRNAPYLPPKFCISIVFNFF